MRSSLALPATLLLLSACGTSPRHTETVPPAARRTDSCAEDRARVSALVMRGKLHRASRVLDRANRLCPRSAPDSWKTELGVLMDLGLVHRVRLLVTDIEEAADVPVGAKAATFASRSP